MTERRTAMWAEIDYFHGGTAKARRILERLEPVDRQEWYELYRDKIDGRFWRIDMADKYQQRYIVRIPDVAHWREFDSSQLERQLLRSSRGGESEERCVVMGCTEKALKGLAFCLPHAYERGVRK